MLPNCLPARRHVAMLTQVLFGKLFDREQCELKMTGNKIRCSDSIFEDHHQSSMLNRSQTEISCEPAIEKEMNKMPDVF